MHWLPLLESIDRSPLRLEAIEFEVSPLLDAKQTIEGRGMLGFWLVIIGICSRTQFWQFSGFVSPVHNMEFSVEE